ncbi:unnamed protein product [Fusarium graminearum]|nr:unnamed protein product [Fusarium graminearum]
MPMAIKTSYFEKKSEIKCPAMALLGVYYLEVEPDCSSVYLYPVLRLQDRRHLLFPVEGLNDSRLAYDQTLYSDFGSFVLKFAVDIDPVHSADLNRTAMESVLGLKVSINFAVCHSRRERLDKVRKCSPCTFVEYLEFKRHQINTRLLADAPGHSVDERVVGVLATDLAGPSDPAKGGVLNREKSAFEGVELLLGDIGEEWRLQIHKIAGCPGVSTSPSEKRSKCRPVPSRYLVTSATAGWSNSLAMMLYASTPEKPACKSFSCYVPALTYGSFSWPSSLSHQPDGGPMI